MSRSTKLNSLRRFICRHTRTERGFFNIVGLCLLLAVAISIRGVQEFESNYSIGASNYLIEYELQNLADSALIEAAKKIDDSTPEGYVTVSTPINSERLQKLNAEFKVYFLRKNIQDMRDDYVEKADIKTPVKSGDGEAGIALISVARCDNGFFNDASRHEKIYSRSLAYILDADTERVVHFMRNSLKTDKLKDRQE